MLREKLLSSRKMHCNWCGNIPARWRQLGGVASGASPLFSGGRGCGPEQGAYYPGPEVAGQVVKITGGTDVPPALLADAFSPGG